MDSKEELEALGFKFVRRYGSEFYEWAASQYTHQEAVKKIIKNVDYFRVPTDKPVIALHEVSRRLGLKLWDEEYYIGLR